MRRLVLLMVCGAVACGGGDDAPDTAGERIAAGRDTYRSICASCHGADLDGTAAGPSMLDPVLAPATHPDVTFHEAVTDGVVPHGHFEKDTWGAMPAIPTLDREDVTNVIAYVRTEQRRAGVLGP